MRLKLNLDPKISVIKKRLDGVKRIIAVSGFKGGVGKSSTACVLALLLAQNGKKAGLMDLDFNGTSDEIILGLKKEFPQEIEGLEPPLISGVKFMTAAFFARNKAVNLRGEEITNAILELFAVTRWQNLDFLILDMPPGFSDAALDIIRFIPRAEVIIVSTPSALSQNIIAKAKAALKNFNIKITGSIKNMSPEGINFDGKLEAAYGRPAKLLKTRFAADLKKEIERLSLY
ncbi:MAG: P-loop NTPase [Elusimicrobiota bacterium]|jgi:ATP-binding protein involved in chromosome partitioning|nr:P-loop NTPase [Elusimicrobiota bacterium]